MLFLFRHRKRKKEREIIDQAEADNPFLPYIRPILCDVLRQRGLSYQNLRLLVIDGTEDLDTIFWEDEVLQALNDLSEDLNDLTILTGRPAYFQEYIEKMYEETGLLVRMLAKEPGQGRREKQILSNVVLDFESKGGMWNLHLADPGLYIPVYKKPWKTAENLDICVPIGYNTVIAKSIGNI